MPYWYRAYTYFRSTGYPYLNLGKFLDILRGFPDMKIGIFPIVLSPPNNYYGYRKISERMFVEGARECLNLMKTIK
jgi:hypothetical protein